MNHSKDPHETTSKAQLLFEVVVIFQLLKCENSVGSFSLRVKHIHPSEKLSFFLEVKWSGNRWRHPNQATYRMAPIYGVIVYRPRFTIKINQKGKYAKNETWSLWVLVCLKGTGSFHRFFTSLELVRVGASGFKCLRIESMFPYMDLWWLMSC